MGKSESCGLYNNDVSTRNQEGVRSGNYLPLLQTTQAFRAEVRKEKYLLQTSKLSWKMS